MGIKQHLVIVDEMMRVEIVSLHESYQDKQGFTFQCIGFKETKGYLVCPHHLKGSLSTGLPA